MGLSFIGAIKELIGLDPVRLDEDPIKDQIKQSWLQRRRGHFEEAIQILQDLLKVVMAEGEESMSVTRVLDELANAYYYKGDLDVALEQFRLVVQRLIKLHGKNEESPEFIGISLKMADILARMGELDNAEVGYRHCVSKQMKIVEKHMSKFFVSKGASMEEMHKVDTFGPVYTDPLALFAMAMQQFAHFIIDYRDEAREKEAHELMDEVIKLSYHIFGPNHAHSIHIINNFGAACILRNRFETALKYLQLGIDKVLNNNECDDIIVGYYCNYAEALFHTNHFDEALKYADGAVRLSTDSPESLRKYAEKFQQQMKHDLRRAKSQSGRKGAAEAEGGRSWFGWRGKDAGPEPIPAVNPGATPTAIPS